MNIKKYYTAILAGLLYGDIFTKGEALSIINELSEPNSIDVNKKIVPSKVWPLNNIFWTAPTSCQEETVSEIAYKNGKQTPKIPQEIFIKLIHKITPDIRDYFFCKIFLDMDMHDFFNFKKLSTQSSSHRLVATAESRKTPPSVLDEKQSTNQVDAHRVTLNSLFTGRIKMIALAVIIPTAGIVFWICLPFNKKSDTITDNHNQDKYFSNASVPTTAASRIAGQPEELENTTPRPTISSEQLAQRIGADVTVHTPHRGSTDPINSVLSSGSRQDATPVMSRLPGSQSPGDNWTC